jgi:hypothetical protein
MRFAPNSKHRALVTPAQRGKGRKPAEQGCSEKTVAERRKAMTCTLKGASRDATPQACLKKTDEKLNDRGSEDETKRRHFRVERAIGQFMPWFPMIGFSQKGALCLLYPPQYGDALSLRALKA